MWKNKWNWKINGSKFFIDIPPDIQIKSTIQPGSVYYFTETSFYNPEPHYFIVLNKAPLKDKFLILVNSTSQVEKAIKRRRHSPNTLVKIDNTEYAIFTKESVVDCNSVMKKTIEEIVDLLKSNKLSYKPEMPIGIIEKLREAVIASPIVENYIKEMLKAWVFNMLTNVVESSLHVLVDTLWGIGL